MKSTDQLSHDHRAILRGLEILTSAAAAWKRNPLEGADDCRALVDFFKTFADRCHHSKEEKVLFPKLREAGIPVDGGPLGVMLYEHDKGRQLIRSMEQALDSRRPADFAAYANQYAELLEDHIAKEDNVLFAKAEHVLTNEDDEAILGRFDEIEHEMGEETHETFHRMLDRLSLRYGLKPSKAS
jgi:hemerythrin-like domain-containing protein